VVSVGELWTYLGFFVLLVAAGLGLPAPEEIVVSGAGVLAGQLPPEPIIVEVPLAYPSSAEVAGLLAVDPNAGFPAALPWTALVRSAAPHQLSAEDVTALLAIDPRAGSLGALPWAALVRASPPLEEVSLPPKGDSIRARWWILLPVCICGVVFSDVLLYVLGRWFGEWLFNRPWMARILPPDKHKRTVENFHRYGVGILIFGRLVPGIRMPLFLTAGSMRLPLPRFLLADGLGAVVGNSLFFFLGFWLGDSIKTLLGQAEERLRPILIVIAVGLAVAYLLWHFLRHPVPTGDPQDVPLIGPQVASHLEGEHAAGEEAEKRKGTPTEERKKPPVEREDGKFRLSSFLYYRWRYLLFLGLLAGTVMVVDRQRRKRKDAPQK
jgi:membrane protein DedA with SNARE-associated domain